LASSSPLAAFGAGAVSSDREFFSFVPGATGLQDKEADEKNKKKRYGKSFLSHNASLVD